MRRAVEHLASERADIVEQPAMQFTPVCLGSRIEAIAISSRRTDHERISQAQNDLYNATQNMRAVTVHARTDAEQQSHLFQGVGCGVIAGILL